MPYAAPAQRHYFFNEDGSVKATSEEKQTEERLLLLKKKMAAQGIDTNENPDIPPPNNPYYKDFVDEMELNANPQGASDE